MSEFHYNYSMNYIFNNNEYKNRLLERFLRYVKIWTESDGAAADKGVFPSTQRQFDLAIILGHELKALGLEQVQITPDCYVYGYLPGDGTPILFLAHMDTVDEVSGKDVKPVVEQIKDPCIGFIEKKFCN